MKIEDLVISLTLSRIPLNAWDEKLMNSFYDQISRGSGFTEKQSVLALKTLSRHASALSDFLKTNISDYLQNPAYRLPIRQINNSKKIYVDNDILFGKVINAVFPYNEKIVEVIRRHRDQLGYAAWDKDQKLWKFSLSEQNIQFLAGIAEQEKFETDEYFETFKNQIKIVHDSMENYIPMLVIENKIPTLKNCHENMPKLTTTDMLESIFEARKRGVCTWDETFSQFIESDQVDPITREFLKSDPSDKLQVDSDIHGISVFSDIVKYLGPTLVVIPGGLELETLTKSYEFFKSTGVSDSEMSVMFRLPTSSHEIFNNFVKNHNLNSPLSEQTKVVFVSSKMPKPVLKSKIKFHCVLNMGFTNVHYTMKDFIGKHENLMFYSKQKELRNAKFGFM